MRNILAPRNRPLLARFAATNTLLAFDYDGTLAPIVGDPRRAAMRRRTRDLLAALAERYPCIVISGRARADACIRLRGVGVRAVVGNHGAETARAPNSFAPQVARWRARLARRLAQHPGVAVEDKGGSLAIHYRDSPEKRKARVAALRAAGDLGAIRIVVGKQVVNVLPEGSPHKGDALERERLRLGCDAAIYVGDDETDEDVFRLARAAHLLTIRVGAKRASRAAYCIRDQRQIDPLLAALARLRRPSDGDRRATR
jgi:trehalose 6-phosphate phosphatase